MGHILDGKSNAIIDGRLTTSTLWNPDQTLAISQSNASVGYNVGCKEAIKRL